MNRPADRLEPGPGRVYLYPGQFTVASVSCTVTTILGSCVAVSVYDPVARTGGLNHHLLPRAPEGDPSLRFGDVAVPQLIAAVLQAGAEPHRLLAKIVGGACVLDAYRDRPNHVGRQNVRVALDTLSQASIPVVMMDVEGSRGRRVVFNPHTGDLMVRSL
jgi:chemotaxis protein CheD